MNYRNIIKGVYDKIVIQTIKNTEEIPDVNSWYELLGKIGHDNNPVQESYRKHICRMTYFSPLKKIAINILSFLYLLLQPYHCVDRELRKA